MLREQRLCAACGERIKQEIQSTRLWPVGYIWGVGVLLNGVTGAILSALNWKRLGDERRAREAWTIAGIGAAAFVAIIAIPKVPGVLGMVVSIAMTRHAVKGLEVPWSTHKAQSGPVANRLLPILATLGGLIVVVGLYVAVLMALGVDVDEG